jgi:hypothetical protein
MDLLPVSELLFLFLYTIGDVDLPLSYNKREAEFTFCGFEKEHGKATHYEYSRTINLSN